MTLFAFQHVGQHKTYALKLADDDGAEHPVAGTSWTIVEHLTPEGKRSVRPLAAIAPSDDGMSAEIKTFSWPGRIVVEVAVDAPHPTPDDPLAMPRSTTFVDRIVIAIPEIPPISKTLGLHILPEGIERTTAPITQFGDVQIADRIH
jgi:hypothetical protein